MGINRQIFSYGIGSVGIRAYVFNGEGGIERGLVSISFDINEIGGSASVTAWGTANDLRELSRAFLTAAASVEANEGAAL